VVVSSAKLVKICLTKKN